MAIDDQLLDYHSHDSDHHREVATRSISTRWICQCGAKTFEVVRKDSGYEFTTYVHCVVCDQWALVHHG